MEQKIKIENTSNHAVNINLISFNGKFYPTMPKGFANLNEDEYAYLCNTSKIFEVGSLKVHGNMPEGIEPPIESPNALTDADINTMLKKPQKQIELSLADITNIRVVQRILELAKEADKGIKVIEAIEARINALMD